MDCVAFLQWALPRVGMRWAGFRKVRRQVCRRVRARMSELGLASFADYRDRLETHPEEWEAFERLVPITISRFRRDRVVWDALEREVLPALSAGRVRAWSAGCASGEEPYTLALLWERSPGLRDVPLELLATDIDERMLERARRAVYEASSLRELPAEQRDAGFDEGGRLREEHRGRVTFRCHDVRAPAPGGPFDLVLCRNLAFTYFDEATQRSVLAEIARVLRPGGALVLGLHDRLPDPAPEFEPWPGARAVWRRTAARDESGTRQVP
jgi:chemotaxis protein methyltransferase CheR